MAAADGQRYRILHLIAQLRFGAGRYLADVAVEQHRRDPGHIAVAVGDDEEEPWISSPALIDELRGRGIPVLRCGNIFRRDAAGLKRAAARVRAIAGPWPGGSVAHAHTAMSAVVARWADAPTVVASCHGWNLERPAAFDLQDALAFSICDAVTTPSRQWARQIEERTAVERADLIPYGLDLERYPSLRREPNEAAPLRVVSVAEITERKGPDVLLHAMAAVWARIPDVELHFVGGGEREADMRALAGTLDAGRGCVRFHGMVAAPYPLLEQFDLFALASRSDNLPIAIIEALCAGLPVVSTTVGGIPELVDEGWGRLVPPDDPGALAAALTAMLERGRADLQARGAKGEEFARRTFDIRSHVDALTRLYDAARESAARVPAGR